MRSIDVFWSAWVVCVLVLFANAPPRRTLLFPRIAARAGLVLVAMMALVVVTGPTICDFSGLGPKIAKLQICSFEYALMRYRTREGVYPDTLEDLVASGDFDRLPRDPWDQPYEYHYYGSHYVLRTFGADHRLGGSGMDADIDRFAVIEDTDTGPSPAKVRCQTRFPEW